MAFKACEPSEAMIRALEARLRNKNATSASAEANTSIAREDASNSRNETASISRCPVVSVAAPAAFSTSVHSSRASEAMAEKPQVILGGRGTIAFAPSASVAISESCSPITGSSHAKSSTHPGSLALDARRETMASSTSSGRSTPASSAVASSRGFSASIRNPVHDVVSGTDARHAPYPASEADAASQLASSLPDEEDVLHQTFGTSRPSTAGRSTRSAQHLPPSMHRSSSALDLLNDKVRQARVQGDRLHDHCNDLEQRLKEVEQSQAAAMALATDPNPEDRDPSRLNPEAGSIQRLPTAVTVGGIPVATDGELVYLGGGLYAATMLPAENEPRPPPVRRRRKVMPGQVRPLLPRPSGSRSSMRSASAHGDATPSGAGETRDCSPSPLRAHSEGQISRESTGMISSNAVNGPREMGRGQSAPRGWRPAGVARLPPTPEPSTRSGQTTPASLPDGTIPTAGHSEGRAAARLQARREGMLNHPRMTEDPEQPVVPSALVSGPPLHGDRRAAERRAAKEARVQQLLDERALRLAAPQQVATCAPKTIHRSSKSAPTLPSMQPAGNLPKQELERQKLRLASKMEILEDLFKGCRNPMGKMSVDQTKALLAKFHGMSNEADTFAAHDQGEQDEDSDGTFRQYVDTDVSSVGEQTGTVMGRLQEANDFCNRAFEVVDVDL